MIRKAIAITCYIRLLHCQPAASKSTAWLVFAALSFCDRYMPPCQPLRTPAGGHTTNMRAQTFRCQCRRQQVSRLAAAKWRSKIAERLHRTAAKNGCIVRTPGLRNSATHSLSWVFGTSVVTLIRRTVSRTCTGTLARGKQPTTISQKHSDDKPQGHANSDLGSAWWSAALPHIPGTVGA